MNFQLTQIVLIIMASQLIVFILFLFLKKNNNTSNYILGFFFVCQFILTSGSLLSEIYPRQQTTYYYDAIYWIVSPLLYFYVKSITGKFRIKESYYHFIPFAIFLFINSLCIYSVRILQNCNFCLLCSFHSVWLYELMLRLCQFLIYSILCIREIRKYRDEVKESYSFVKKTNLKWLNIIAVWFIISWVINAVAILLYLYVGIHSIDKFLLLLPYLQFLIYFNILFFYAWSIPRVFQGPSESNENKKNIRDSSQSIEFERLLTHMNNNKPYLNSALTIYDLSNQLSIPSKNISQLIHDNLNRNFYDFINYYRVDEVKSILTLNKKLKTDLVSLGLDCGFSSKASFFRVFKKVTGLTPKQFFDEIHKKAN